RDFEDDEGKQREIFFVAVPRIQVENLETTCRMAGLKLVAVEIEPLALKRLLVPGNEGGVRAFLHLGASRSYFSVFEEEILLFYRSISSFYENIRFIIGEDPAGLEQINISQDGQFKFIIRDLIAEVGRLVEYYNIQSGKKIEGLYLCGGGASLQGLDEALNTQISCPVETADNLESFELSFDGDESVRRELNYDFPVALGLALREVI
ncbi:MAG: pilus assembly protein PilM, partial [Syntrophomonas sp.]